jgi:hypothetical protein
MDKISNAFSETSASIVPSSDSLLETSSSLTIVAFLLLVIIACILIFSFGSSLIYYFMKAPSKLYLVNGMVPGNQQKIIYQNPALANSATIYRSVNESKGIEFTWSLWLNVNAINFNQNVYSPIFYKGNNNLNSVGLNYPANAPGLYLEPMKNNLLLIMNTFKEINEEIQIPDIPLNKWINVIIRCQNKTLDVYINGTITRSLELSDVPKQNYGNVYIGTNGGFNGFLSNLMYFTYSLGPGQISTLVSKGPNLKAADGYDGVFNKFSDFLSLRWYFPTPNN